MTPDQAKALISNLIDLRSEITRYGGAEEANGLWRKYSEQRTILYRHFALPETVENLKLLNLPKMPETETLGLSLSGSPDDLQINDARQLADILNQVRIIGTNDPRMIEHRKRRIVTRIHQKLYLKAFYEHTSPPLTQMEILELGKEKRIPAKDLLLQLGYFIEPYQLFLITIIYYLGYGSSKQVLIELRQAQVINSIWSFTEYSSPFLLEKQIGIDNLRASGLKFVEQFLWWERDETILRYFS